MSTNINSKARTHVYKTVKSEKETSDNFMQRYSLIHAKRINHTREMCRFYRDKIPKPVNTPLLLVNEEHKIVYCQTPKAGTVSWCRILLILAGYKNYTEVMNMTAPEVSSAWKTNVTIFQRFSYKKQREIMDTYTKFMFVRHPFSRLLSAFNQKLGPHLQSYGRFQDIFNQILKNFKWDHNDKSQTVKFKDFLNLVINGSARHSSDHWREMYTVCYPCDVPYDIIGYFEDIENDSKYIFNLTNIHNLKFPRSTGAHLTNSSSKDILRNEFSSIPIPILGELYNKFKYDFTLFGYDMPIAIP
ncbi:carbohydrate sulfotransferase 11-like [Antedon mediterranea]|uniref:carbohydrate sulfotransferase 11-like n=1 Tax=Antedon mediterranea TaxID=105859 RepID=UPI003AF85F1B